MALNHNQQEKPLLLGLIKRGGAPLLFDNDSKIQLKQPSLTEVFSAKQWDGNSKQAESANKAVATFIACDLTLKIQKFVLNNKRCISLWTDIHHSKLSEINVNFN